ncbi:MAG: Maf family nucleotide pyrophosphatase [Bacteroidales bacterium]|jgi:septum formation protein|nr:Maf family nucleotide pyrophosphatase [Bacteroidales bacterium]
MGIDDLNKFRIILGSRSPRRQELLRELGLEFEVVTKDWDEFYPAYLTGPEIALYVAEEKAKSFIPEIKGNEIVITADTIVWCNGEVLSKPSDREDAMRIIRKISGRTHEVITGVCLLSSVKMVSFQSSTRVTFSELSDEEIVHYISRYKPYDKAGAYGIQEWIGIAACSSIEGSYFNVVGLPVEQVYRELKKFVL